MLYLRFLQMELLDVGEISNLLDIGTLSETRSKGVLSSSP